MIRLIRSLAVIIAMVLSCSVQAQQWAKYETQNFTVYSDRTESVVRELVEELEIFRVIAMLQLGLPVEETANQKLKVIMFGDNREFQRVAQSENAVYNYVSGKPVMAAGPSRGRNREFSKEMFFYSYAQLLTREHSFGFTYPRWYLHGIASVIGATIIERDSVAVGRRPAHAWAISNYGTLKMIDVLQNRQPIHDSTNFDARFYGTSWLLTHYLQIHGLANDRELGGKTRDYLRRYHEGQDSVTAFEQVFGPLDEFDGVIDAYSRQSRLPVLNWTKPDISMQLTKHAIYETEKDYVIAELLYSLGQEDMALEYLSSSDAALQYSGEALSLKAVILNYDATTADQASKSAEEAVGIANLSARALGNLAQYEVISYRRLKEAGEEAEASVRLARAKEYAESSLAKDGTEFDALWFKAGIFIEEDKLEAALETLFAAWNVHPVGYTVRLQIITLLLRLGDIESAKPIVRSLIGAANDPQVSQQLAQMAEKLDKGEVDLSILDEISDAHEAESAADTSSNRVLRRSRGTGPIF